MHKYEHLFQPIKIGKREVKNRIFMPPISTNLANKGEAPLRDRKERCSRNPS